LERRRRIDRTLYAAMMDASVQRISTRKVGDLVKALGAASGISKSEVSRICAELDQDLDAFPDGPSTTSASPTCSSTRPTKGRLTLTNVDDHDDVDTPRGTRSQGLCLAPSRIRLVQCRE
jgi:hypothetical protein